MLGRLLQFPRSLAVGNDRAKSDTARKSDAVSRIQLYQDNSHEQAYADLAMRFKSPESFRLFGLNVLGRVINAKAQVYRRPPVRESEHAEDILDLYHAVGMDSFMLSANRYTELLRTTLVYIQYRPDTDPPLRLELVTPNLADVTLDEYGAVESVRIQRSGKDGAPVYVNCSVDEVITESEGGNLIEKHSNSYGLIPVVPLHAAYPLGGTFWQTGLGDLLNTQKTINVTAINLLRSCEMQAYGQPVIVGDVDTQMKNLGPDTVLTLPADSSFTFESPKTPIQQQIQAIRFLMKSAALTNGLPAHLLDPETQSRQPESGVSRGFSEQGLTEYRREVIPLWERYERQIFDVVCTLYNHHNGRDAAGSYDLSVDFTEVGKEPSDTELLDIWERRLRLGLADKADAILAMHSDIEDRDAALDYLAERFGDGDPILEPPEVPHGDGE